MIQDISTGVQDFDFQRQQQQSSQQDDEDDQNSETSSVFDERQFIRVSTAPPRPLTDIEEFKRSQEFILLEQAVVCSQHLIQKHYQKYDLDSQEGQKICKRYLSIVEKMCETYQVATALRDYRKEFSKAYKILYKEGQLCYLTEILDSAQEGFPYLWVNGEKYVFSPEVLEAGQKLLQSFFKMQHIMRNAYSRSCQENIANCSAQAIRQEIILSLESFDDCWAKFEQLYVLELMLIETDARRFIQKAIDVEKELQSIEIREKIKGRIFLMDSEITNYKKKLCKIISQINAVANVDGKGRDDLQFEILQESEVILRTITKEQSQAVRYLAEQIRNSFSKLRNLFRKYEQNIEMVDPQLKNNYDLVETLQEYETSWEKGKSYFLDPKKCIFLKHFSHIIEATGQKHKDFQEQVDCRDADIFLNIPCLMVLKCLNNEDKNICRFFLPQLYEPQGNKHNTMFENLKEEFNAWKQGHIKQYEFHNILEKILLGITLNINDQATIGEYNRQVNNIVHKIKQLAMELQRNNPMEWNNFLDAALCQPPNNNTLQ
ncbi:hypothetical protein ABPG72_009979 [Tetrahymena utriculariae]